MNFGNLFFYWVLMVDTSVLDDNGDPGPSLIIHLCTVDEHIEKNEGRKVLIYDYDSCCGKEGVSSDCPPSAPDNDSFFEPPAPGSKYEKYYCTDCIKIWEKMQSH